MHGSSVMEFPNWVQVKEKTLYLSPPGLEPSACTTLWPLLQRLTRADQKTGALWRFSGRTSMHGKSRVSSAIRYDCFKLDGSGNCIIRKTWLHCIWFEKKFRLNEVIPHCCKRALTPGGNSTLIRRVCATGVLNLSPCSGVGKLKKDTLLWSYHSFYCILLYCIGDKDHVYALLI